MKNLKSLDVSNNRLKTLPDSFDSLKNLENFGASENKITDIPSTLLALKSLKNINFKRNPVDAEAFAKLTQKVAQNNKPLKVGACVLCTKSSEQIKNLLKKFERTKKT